MQALQLVFLKIWFRLESEQGLWLECNFSIVKFSGLIPFPFYLSIPEWFLWVCPNTNIVEVINTGFQRNFSNTYIDTLFQMSQNKFKHPHGVIFSLYMMRMVSSSCYYYFKFLYPPTSIFRVWCSTVSSLTGRYLPLIWWEWWVHSVFVSYTHSITWCRRGYRVSFKT